MILAAGFGTRFRPVTHSVPKPMIPVLNRPLLGWAVEACLAAGLNEIVVNLHHIPGPIRTYLDETFGSRASFELSEEEEILGTGGALRKVRDLLGDEFVVMNGDTIQWPPFEELIEQRRRLDALACLLLRHAPPEDSFTRVWLDQGRITGFGEGNGEALMFAGAHAISPAILDLLPERDFSGLTEDVYIPAVRRGEPLLAGFQRDGLWFDVGTPARYMEATRGLLEAIDRGDLEAPGESRVVGGGSLLHPSVEIDGTVERSSVGADSQIGRGSTVRRSVLWSSVITGAGTRLEGSILSHGTCLPDGSEVANCLVVPAARTASEDLDRSERIGEWDVRAVDESKPWVFRAG